MAKKPHYNTFSLSVQNMGMKFFLTSSLEQVSIQLHRLFHSLASGAIYY
jgi:hypothetical protein